MQRGLARDATLQAAHSACLLLNACVGNVVGQQMLPLVALELQLLLHNCCQLAPLPERRQLGALGVRHRCNCEPCGRWVSTPVGDGFLLRDERMPEFEPSTAAILVC